MIQFTKSISFDDPCAGYTYSKKSLTDDQILNEEKQHNS